MTRLLIALLLLTTSLSACGVRIPGLTPYKIDIQQGNYVSQEMASQLKPGMSKEQVRITLGTPLLADAFHADRWDYVYWREASDGKRETRKLTVFFSDNKLVRADGDIVPLQKGGEGAPDPTLPAPPAKPPALSPAPPTAPGGGAQPAPAGPEAPATRGPAPGPAQETR